MDKIIEKWDEILNTVKKEYEISDVSFDTWIRPLEVFAIEGNTLYILVPSEQMALTYISKKYLEQIVPVLNRSDILRTNRGFQGGYRLAKSPNQYTVGEILRLTEGSLAPVACLEQEPNECARSGECPTLPVWQGLYRVVNEYLDGITLQDILDQQKERYANDYMI